MCVMFIVGPIERVFYVRVLYSVRVQLHYVSYQQGIGYLH